MQARDLVEHEHRWPRTTSEDLIRAPIVSEVERLELRADLLAEAHPNAPIHASLSMVAATRRPQWRAEATSEAPGVNLPNYRT
jgi:hypothetical protein